MNKEKQTLDNSKNGNDFIADVMRSCSNCKLFNKEKRCCEHAAFANDWYETENVEHLHVDCSRFEQK